MLLRNVKLTLDDGQFINSTNWVTVKRATLDLAGIKTDGTLWVSEKPRQFTRQQGQWEINEDEMRHLEQFGTETNWNSVESLGNSVFLTKTDGTLWRWGTFDFRDEARTNRWPGLRAFTPERLGTESNWANVYRDGYAISFRKLDGSIWTAIL